MAVSAASKGRAEVVNGPGVSPVKLSGVAGAVVNMAVTDLTASMIRLQAPRPLQSPDQPANVEPLAGVTVSVTAVPLTRDIGQVLATGQGPPEMPFE